MACEHQEFEPSWLRLSYCREPWQRTAAQALHATEGGGERILAALRAGAIDPYTAVDRVLGEEND